MNRTLLSLLIAALLLPGCKPSQPAATEPAATAPAPAATTAPAPTPAASADVFRFKIGALDAAALKDGDIDTPNDGKTFGVGQPIEQVVAVLQAAGVDTGVLHLSIQPLLVRSGERVLLFDTGAAGVSFAKGGRLTASLRAAGVEPAQVTDIFISHRHDDHVGGLLTQDGALAFANATVHLSAPEWDALKADTKAKALVAALTPKVDAFKPGAELVPGVVTAVANDGHTPGHSAYEITSGNERLLYIGDTAHHYVVSVQQPDWTIAYDENPKIAEPRRRELLQRAADQDLRVYAVHFPFPGLGRIVEQPQGLVWSPEG